VPKLSDSELLSLLKAVSRSFYLSVRFLPGRIRATVAVGYLVARASDSIADTNRLESDRRLHALSILSASLQDFRQSLIPELQACIAAHPDGVERTLLTNLEWILDFIRSLPARHQELLLDVLTKIIHGQSLDIRRFGGAGSSRTLKTEDELDEYTYLVAGSVGEFWTELCLGEWRNYSRISQPEIVRLGVEFGKGLQLINILRDFPADVKAGRSYLPVSDPLILQKDLEAARDLYGRWHQKAVGLMDSAWGYVRAVRPIRIRFACALPVLIGVRTLARLRSAPEIVAGAKVTRAEVYWLVVLSVIIAAVPAAQSAVYRREFKAVGRSGV
jgi:farnesyl-diphosphate farnesyltransferase